MKRIYHLALAGMVLALVAPLNLLCAAEANPEPTLNDEFNRVNTWLEGKITSVDADKGTFSVEGQKLPFATAHAQMRKEFEEKAAKAPAAKRSQIAEQINREWRSKLMAAQGEKAGATETFDLKAPSNGDLVMLTQKSVQDVTFAYQPDEGPKSAGNEPNLAGELVSIDIYDIPAKSSATPTAASSTLRDVKSGDVVKIGLDSSSNEACLMIVLNGGHDKAR